MLNSIYDTVGSYICEQNYMNVFIMVRCTRVVSQLARIRRTRTRTRTLLTPKEIHLNIKIGASI